MQPRSTCFPKKKNLESATENDVTTIIPNVGTSSYEKLCRSSSFDCTLSTANLRQLPPKSYSIERSVSLTAEQYFLTVCSSARNLLCR